MDPVSAVANAVTAIAGVIPPPLSERTRVVRAVGRSMRLAEWYYARWSFELRPRRKERWRPRLLARIWQARSALVAAEFGPRSREALRLSAMLREIKP